MSSKKIFFFFFEVKRKTRFGRVENKYPPWLKFCNKYMLNMLQKNFLKNIEKYLKN